MSYLKLKKLFSFILGFQMILIMGFRSPTVGKDLENYFSLYSSISSISISETSTEPGFVFFLKVLNLAGIGEQGFILLTSLIVSTLITWFIYKYSENIFLSFFLHITIGLFAFSLSGIRQSLGISLILIAIYFTLEKKWLKAVIINLVAISIHYSALIYLPFIALGYYNIKDIKKIKNKTYLYFTIILLVIFISMFTNWFSIVFSSFETIEVYYTKYLGRDLNLIYIFALSSIPLLLFFVLKIKGKWWLKINKEDYFFFELIIALSIIFILSTNLNLISRLSYYFYLPLIVIIPNTVNMLNKKNNKIIVSLICIFLAYIYFSLSFSGSILNIDNYKFFFQ